MKEQFISSSELTRGKPYSTLNTAHSLPNVRFIMDSTPNNENKPKSHTERRNLFQPKVASPEQELAEIIARRIARNETQAAAESHRVLVEMGAAQVSGKSEHPYDVMQRQKAESPLPNINPVPSEHPDDKAWREARFKEREGAQIHPDLKDVALLGGTDYGISVTGIADGALTAKLEQIQQELNVELSETEAVRGMAKATQEILQMRSRGVSEADINTAIAKLNNFRRIYSKKHSADQEDKRFRGFSLQWRDMQDIDKGAETWLDGQFDILYDLAEKGGELLDSPQVRAIEAKFNEAVGYLLLEGRSIEEVVAIQNKYNIQTSLIYASASVGRRNLEGIQGSVVRLKTEGLFTALSFNGGRVGAMLNRMADMVNITRVSEGGFVDEGHGDHHEITSERQHLDNKMINDVKKRLISEQFDLAVYAGVGSYGDRYEEIKIHLANRPREEGEPALTPEILEKEAQEQLRKEIRGNINVAHDAYLITQMQAVEASKGKRIERHPYAFFTDPKGIFDFLNIEEFLTNKWGTLNHEQMLFLRQMKLDLAKNEARGNDVKNLDIEGLEELGGRMFKELFTVPDFYSSGWRIAGIRDHIARLQEYHLENRRLQGHVAGGNLDILDASGVDTPKGKKDDTTLESLRTKIQNVREKVRDWSVREKADAIRAEERRIDADTSLSPEEKTERKTEYRNRILSRRVYTPEEKQKEYLNFLSRKAVDGGLTMEERSLYLSKIITTDRERLDIHTLAKNNAEEFALFLALKASGSRAEKVAAWGKIQKYKPEEMIKFVRERKGQIGDWDELREIDKIFTENGIQGTEKTDYSGNVIQIRAADVFRRDILPALSMIREEGFRGVPPEQIDFRNINESRYATYKEKINRALKGVWTPSAANPNMLPSDMIVNLLGSMDTYINNNGVTSQFIDKSEYEDLGARVQKADDLILDQLENVPENMPAGNVSSYWTSEAAGDALVRNYNDIKNAQEAGGHLVKFLTTEGKDEYLKAATAFAHSVKEYNGWSGAAKAMRYTFGSYLLIAEQDHVVDTLGIGKIGRLATSDIQRIFGQGVDPITREQMLKIMDHIRGHLTTDDHDDPEKYYNELMNQLGVDGLSRLKDKSAAAIIYLAFLLLLGSSLAAGTAAFKEASK